MTTNYLQASEINRDSVIDLFNAAMIKAEPIVEDPDQDMILCRELGWKIMVRVDPDKELITFHCPMGINAETSMKRKLDFVNRMSKQFILVNVVLLDEDSMLSEYQFLYDNGMSPHFLIHSFKRFVEISKSIAAEAGRRKLGFEKSDEDPFGLFEGTDMNEILRSLTESSGNDEETASK